MTDNHDPETLSNLKIVSLEVENIMRVKAVTVRPDGTLVIVGGQNEQGKTSTIDAIVMALSGGKAIPVMPVRMGAASARIVADLGPIVVERIFNAKGTKLLVRWADGTEQKSPQTLLNTLIESICFDPLAFYQKKPEDQDKELRALLKLDMSDLEAEHQRIFEARAELNRRARDLEGKLRSTRYHVNEAGLRIEAVSVSELADKLKDAEDASAQSAALRRKHEQNRQNVAEAEKRRMEAEQKLREAEQALESAIQAETEACKLCDASAEELNARPTAEQDVAAVDAARAALKTADETNAKARENAQLAEDEKTLRATQKAAEECTQNLDSIAEQKEKRLRDAEFPIPGLGFNELGPTYKGAPIKQASKSAQIRLSVALGLALNPKMKVLLIRDGSLLDEGNLAMIAEMAEAVGGQVWVERVTKRPEECTVYIEDGVVVEGSGLGALEDQ